MRGFTLLEGLVASAVLAIVVLAVGAAVSTGRQVSVEGQKVVLGAMAADDLLAELSTQPYDTLLGYDGYEQEEGSLETLDGEAYPVSYWNLGRSVEAVEETITLSGVGVNVLGVTLTVTSFDEHRVLASLETFIPEPAE